MYKPSPYVICIVTSQEFITDGIEIYAEYMISSTHRQISYLVYYCGAVLGGKPNANPDHFCDCGAKIVSINSASVKARV